jgi:serine/threonine protein phosphatase PrpC
MAIYDIAALSDVGPERPNNEDRVAHWADGDDTALMVVADGVGGYEGGEIASETAVSVTLQAFRDSPRAWGVAKRLYRAVQQANIEIYDKAIVVPELRSMGTTITAAAVEGATLHVAHVGDSRLYLLRDRDITQLTKDHTVAAERVRQGLLKASRAKHHSGSGVLTRRLGSELITAVDRITRPLAEGDTLVACTDGLYNAITDDDILALSWGLVSADAASLLVAEANARGTVDNVTAAVLRVTGPLPEPPPVPAWRGTLRRLLDG